MSEKFFNISLTSDELTCLIDSLSFELSVDPLRSDSVRMTKMRLRERFRNLITNYRKSVLKDCIPFDLFE